MVLCVTGTPGHWELRSWDTDSPQPPEGKSVLDVNQC